MPTILELVPARVIASIPSPSSGAFHIGPFQLRAYGLMIAIGVIAAVSMAGRRLEAGGYGHRDDIAAVALWAVPAGIIGSRIYHVITDWKSFRGDWWRVFKIWEGGLGIWGGIAGGVLVGLWAARRRGLRPAAALWAATPALPLAQAIGRLGNWWNQELFGRPTTLPWGLEIARDHRPAAYLDRATFHPTFLYELLWDLLLCVGLLWIDRRHRPRAGRLFAMYVAGYTFMRFFIERLRVDQASLVLGLRVNEWVAGVVFVVAAAYVVSTRGSQRPVVAAEAVAADVEDDVDDDEPADESDGDEADGDEASVDAGQADGDGQTNEPEAHEADDNVDETNRDDDVIGS